MGTGAAGGPVGVGPPPSALRQLLDLSEDLFRLRQLTLAVTLDEANLPLRVHDEGRPAVGVPIGPVDAVVLRGAAMGVREQRVVADADRLAPVLVAERAVRADTQHLGIGRLKVAHALVEGGHALASARRPVHRVEENDHVLAVEVAEADLLEADRLERKRGRGIADVESLVLAHSLKPPFANRLGAREIILARGSAVAGTGGFRAAAHARLRRLSSGASDSPR